MDARRVNMIEQVGYVVFFVDLTDANEEEVCTTFEELFRAAFSTESFFAIINQTNQLKITPNMRIRMSWLSSKLSDTGRLIGISIFGQDRFLSYIIKRAYSEITFGVNLEDCLEIIKNQFSERKATN